MFWKKKKKIKFLNKEDEYKYTVLHDAAHKGNQEIVKILLNTFNDNENEQLIECVMKEDASKYTPLHLASLKGHKEIVQLLLNAFNEKNKSKLIKYLNKENKLKETALHCAASQKGNEKIVQLLLNTFSEQNKKKLIEYLTKKNKTNLTSAHLALRNGDAKIAKLLFLELANAKNKIVICDLQFISHLNQDPNAKKKSPLWFIFCEDPRNIILSFLIPNFFDFDYYESLCIFEAKKRTKTDVSEYSDEIILHDDTIVNTSQLQEVQFEDNQKNPWGCFVDLASHWSNWKIDEFRPISQFQTLGVEIGWIIKRVDGELITSLNCKPIREFLEIGKSCTIVFDKQVKINEGNLNDVEKYEISINQAPAIEINEDDLDDVIPKKMKSI
jgi:hypothetical protein